MINMKCSIAIVCLLTVAVANGFQVRSPLTGGTQTALEPANPPMADDWVPKPSPKRASTTPVPVRKVSKAERAQMKNRIIDPDYTLAASVALLGGPLIAWYHPCKLPVVSCVFIFYF